jgi:hypothetical protein
MPLTRTHSATSAVLFALTAGLGLGLGPACDDTPSGSLRADAAVDAAEDATFDASSTNVTVTTYSTVEFDPAATSNVLFAVVRDGDGPWLPLVGEAGTYRAFVTGPRYSVAVACRAALSDGGSSAEVYIVQTTLSETRDHFFYNCGAAPTTWTNLEVLVANASPPLTLWTRYSQAVRFTAESRMMTAARVGDLLITSAVAADEGTPPMSIRMANVDMTSDSRVEADLAANGEPAREAAFTAPPMEIGGSASLTTIALRDFGAGPTVMARPWSETSTRTAPRTKYYLLPVSQMRPGEFSRVTFTMSTPRGRRSVATHVTEAVPIAPELPSYYEPPDPTLALAPYPRATFRFPTRDLPTTEASVYSFLVFSIGDSASGRQERYWRTSISPGWLGPSATGIHEHPDFTGLPGWGAPRVSSSAGTCCSPGAASRGTRRGPPGPPRSCRPGAWPRRRRPVARPGRRRPG